MIEEINRYVVFRASGWVSLRTAIFLLLFIYLFLYCIKFLLSKHFNYDVYWSIILFSIVLSVISRSFLCRFLKCSFYFRCISSWWTALSFTICLNDLLFIMLVVIAYFLPNVWCYSYNLVVLFAKLVYSLGFIKFMCIGVCSASFIE